MSITTISHPGSFHLKQNEDNASAAESAKPTHTAVTPDTSAANAIKDASNTKKSLFSRTVSCLKCLFDWTLYLTLSFATLGIYALVCKLYNTDKIINKQAQEIKALQESMCLHEKQRIDQHKNLSDRLDAYEKKLNQPAEENAALLNGTVTLNTDHLPSNKTTPQTNNTTYKNTARRNSSPFLHAPVPQRDYSHNCSMGLYRNTNSAGIPKTSVSRASTRYDTPSEIKTTRSRSQHTTKPFQ